MIWCVEDDASIRDIEVYALQSTGIEARGFEDGTSFWEALNGGEKPELAVIDVMLPGISGIDLLRRMKASSELCDIPVVMACLLYTSPSPRDYAASRMPSSA